MIMIQQEVLRNQGATRAAIPQVGRGPAVIDTIVVGADKSSAGRAAIAWTAALAPSDATVVVVHAIPPVEELLRDGTPLWPPTWRRSLRQEISGEWCAVLRDAGIAFRIRIVEGTVTAAILGVAETEQADLIVVGARRHDHLLHFQAALGGHLAHRAPCAVMSVPADSPR